MPTLQNQSISVTANIITFFEIHNRPLQRQYASLDSFSVNFFCHHYHLQLHPQITQPLIIRAHDRLITEGGHS
jgi:hypothetical protein